jgi:hypothetical protein
MVAAVNMICEALGGACGSLGGRLSAAGPAVDRLWLLLGQAASESGGGAEATDALQAPEDLTKWLALIGGILIIIFVLGRRRIMRRQGGRGSQGGYGRLSPAAATRRSGDRPAGGAASSAGDVGQNFEGRRQLNDSMHKLMLDLEEMSRQVGGQIDTRLRALNLLIEEADAKIAELRRLGLKDNAGPQSSALSSGKPASSAPAGEAGAAGGHGSGGVADEKYARVYSLAAQGLSVVEIAREMELMTGEVELILALRRTAQGRSAGGGG